MGLFLFKLTYPVGVPIVRGPNDSFASQYNLGACQEDPAIFYLDDSPLLSWTSNKMPDNPGCGKVLVYYQAIPTVPYKLLFHLNSLSFRGVSSRIYPILVTNGLMYKPDKNLVNFLIALLCRSMAITSEYDSDTLFDRWVVLTEQFDFTIFDTLIVLPTMQECIDQTANPAPLREANESKLKGHHTKLNKKLFIKTDETLPPGKAPRIIQNVDPQIQMETAQYARGVALFLKKRFDGYTISQYHGRRVRIFYAAGLTSSELDSGYTACVDGSEDFVMMSGDDSLARVNDVFHESDLTKCDQSQGEGPLLFANRWMAAVGIPSFVRAFVTHACVQPFVAHVQNTKIKGKLKCQMPTGINMTTLLNSICVLGLHLDALTKKSFPLEKESLELGFTFKTQKSYAPGTQTFLKGWFFPPTSSYPRYHWMPLPSAVLKLGKMLKAPVQLTKLKGKPRDTNAVAIKKVAFMISKSLGHVPNDYPILGAFLKVCAALGTANDIEAKILETQKPKLVEAPISRDLAMDYIGLRYRLTSSDIIQMEDMFNAVKVLPAAVSHPGFTRLLQVDYE